MVIVNNMDELVTAATNKESEIEFAPTSWDVAGVNIDWALKIIIPDGARINYHSCQINGVAIPDYFTEANGCTLTSGFNGG